jgi:hypothetical protein
MKTTKQKKTRAGTTPRYDSNEFARRGELIYERTILPKVTPDLDGQFVLIDIESGEYEIGENEMETAERLHRRIPDAQVWFRRIGTRPTRKFGPRPQAVKR